MKNMRKYVLSCFCVLLCAVLLCACGGEPETTEPKEVTYQVTVKDALGNPYTSGVIVRFVRGEEQVAMQVVDDHGVAAKTLEKGDYTVELTFTGDAEDYHYDQTDLTLSADKTELEIVMARTVKGDAVSLYVQSEEHQAYHVSEGCTYVDLTAGERNYFLFTPTRAGTYEFSVIGQADGIGYYGTPFFVLSDDAAENRNGNSFTLSIRADMIGTGDSGTSILVLGIDAGSSENGVLTIQRIGDPEWTLDDEPWVVYPTTAELSAYQVPEGAKLREFDLTASSDAYRLVYNETDGFYHLDSADGPLVLAYLTESTRFLGSIQEMAEMSHICKYFFDEEGNFVKKESYNDCLMAYMACVDENFGVYPLTEDLKYIIQQRGDYAQWWDRDGVMYMAVDSAGNPIPDLNDEIAWLSLCCYVDAG